MSTWQFNEASAVWPNSGQVVSGWFPVIQDLAPLELCRDNPRWRELLQLSTGAGRALEIERLQLIIDWMWSVLALPAVVSVVPDDARGAWAEMLEKRTVKAIDAVYSVDSVSKGADVTIAYVAFYAADAVRYFADVVAYTAYIAEAHNYVVGISDVAAYSAALAVACVADAVEAVGPCLWPSIDPIGLLERLIKIGTNDD